VAAIPRTVNRQGSPWSLGAFALLAWASAACGAVPGEHFATTLHAPDGSYPAAGGE